MSAGDLKVAPSPRREASRRVTAGTVALKSSEARARAEDDVDILKDIEKELGLENELAISGSRVRIFVDSRRYGKQVTVLEGFDPAADLDALARDLKRGLGTGGTRKEHTIELQGDHRKAAKAWLLARGFTVV